MCTRDRFTLWASDVKGQIQVQKFAKFWPFRGPGDQGVWKVAIFTPKGTSLRESTSIEPFCVKIGWGVWPLGRCGGKSQKVTRGSHRNDVSPLTQGLRYRAACDIMVWIWVIFDPMCKRLNYFRCADGLLTVFEISNCEYDAMVDMTLTRPIKVKVDHFDTNWFLIRYFL